MKPARIVVFSMETILYNTFNFFSFRVGKIMNSLRLMERVVDFSY